MDHILIFTRDRAYGKYLKDLSEQLNSGVETIIKEPDAVDPEKFLSAMVVVDTEDLFECVENKFRGNDAVTYIVLSSNQESTLKRKCCRLLHKPLDGRLFQQALSQGLDPRGEKKHKGNGKGRVLEPLVVGSSAAMKTIRSNILRVGDTDLPVLIQGETGTGKGVVARTLHNFSSRNQNPYLEINCANVPSSLLESELFGYKLGAFTGAWKDKLGKLQLAANGTVFLDEISEMDSYMQAKLLQVLQGGEFSPIGSKEDIWVDIRIIAATNAKLKELIAKSRFRSDLYYRLAVISLLMPPLRERKEDIEILCTYFLEKYSCLYGKKSRRLSERLKKMLEHYHWPGNVRELENIIKTLVVMESEEVILEELQMKLEKTGLKPLYFTPADLFPDNKEFSLKETTEKAVKMAEKHLIDKAISRTRGNKKKAAELLCISYKSLLNKTKTYGLNNVTDTKN
ncbi:MAG: sigma-54 dependent transcriptional regulator [Desulfohalobiaceae bacterium]|nr:sigma-54 dependent transcriptional regulator [Desulfohalobiaceae bacterium]